MSPRRPNRPYVWVTGKHTSDFMIEPECWGPDPFREYAEGEAELRRKQLADGTLHVMVEGTKRTRPLAGREADRMRERITAEQQQLPPVFDHSRIGPVRHYLPGLWDFGKYPMLGGPPKVGKSWLLTQLAAALVIPGRRFMDYFEPVELTEEEGKRPVWLIEAENGPDEVHELLLMAGLTPQYRDGVPVYGHPDSPRVLIVDYLEELGGADLFDLSKEANQRFWEEYLHRLPGVPLTWIADGVTEMIESIDTGYGPWFRGFKRTGRALGIPNGLGVGHTSLSSERLFQGVKSLAGPDGLWVYFAKDPDQNPAAQRTFQVGRRLLGPIVPKSPVSMGEDGWLRLLLASESSASAPVVVPADDEEMRRRALLDALLKAGESGAWTTEVTGRGAEGQANRRVLDRMIAAGEVTCQEVNAGRSRGKRWFLVTDRT